MGAATGPNRPRAASFVGTGDRVSWSDETEDPPVRVARSPLTTCCNRLHWVQEVAPRGGQFRAVEARSRPSRRRRKRRPSHGAMSSMWQVGRPVGRLDTGDHLTLAQPRQIRTEQI